MTNPGLQSGRSIRQNRLLSGGGISMMPLRLLLQRQTQLCVSTCCPLPTAYCLLLMPMLMFLLLPLTLHGQTTGRLSGNFQVDAQVYRPDSLIGAPKVNEKLSSNSYANLRFDWGKFSAGMRYEGYLNALQGYDPKFDGVGIPYLFADYQTEDLGFTVGSFYEQFGSGLLLRFTNFRKMLEPGHPGCS
ncbi:MAG: DUF6029 family protein [Bacteroidia bacterium]|nr:DUF6029 family protein [Bacteroidia bacterium]